MATYLPPSNNSLNISQERNNPPYPILATNTNLLLMIIINAIFATNTNLLVLITNPAIFATTMNLLLLITILAIQITILATYVNWIPMPVGQLMRGVVITQGGVMIVA